MTNFKITTALLCQKTFLSPDTGNVNFIDVFNAIELSQEPPIGDFNIVAILRREDGEQPDSDLELKILNPDGSVLTSRALPPEQWIPNEQGTNLTIPARIRFIYSGPHTIQFCIRDDVVADIQVEIHITQTTPVEGPAQPRINTTPQEANAAA